MFLQTSRKMIVQIPLNMIARFGSSPMTIGKTKVAPNMATTCWAPIPTVLPHGSRWRGPTATPGSGSTTSHLNIDMMMHPFCSRDPAPSGHKLVTHMTHPRGRTMPKERRDRWHLLRPGPNRSRRPAGPCQRAISGRSAGDLEDPQRHRDVEAQVRVGRERTEQPLELRDPVPHRVVVEELQPRGLGDVEVGVEQDLERLPQVR